MTAPAPPAMSEELEAMRARKDAAYEERNRVVAALAAIYPAGIKRTDIPGWSDDWHGCVYIDTPEGQLSWHYHDSQAHLFAHLPPYAGEWDGHTTEQKYERLSRLSLRSAPAPGVVVRYIYSTTEDHRYLWVMRRNEHGTFDHVAGPVKTPDLIRDALANKEPAP